MVSISAPVSMRSIMRSAEELLEALSRKSGVLQGWAKLGSGV